MFFLPKECRIAISVKKFPRLFSMKMFSVLHSDKYLPKTMTTMSLKVYNIGYQQLFLYWLMGFIPKATIWEIRQRENTFEQEMSPYELPKHCKLWTMFGT